MRILVASDSFKDGCTSVEACEALSAGISGAGSNAVVIPFPISDGGEGTVDILKYHLGGKLFQVEVSDPLFRRVPASILLLTNQTVFIEMAQASGLQFLDRHERNPLNTSSFGTGEMIKKSLEKGYQKIVFAVGGSATNDLGMGMMSALGVQYLDASGNPLSPIGWNMSKVSKIDKKNLLPKLEQVEFSMITDVNNPLYGSDGAAFIYAGQKGANAEQILYLDQGLRHLGSLMGHDASLDVANIPGTGAAGGVAGAAVTYLNASIEVGIEKIGSLVGLENEILAADLVITGEGRLDDQTESGKVISGISKLTRKHHKPLVVFCGSSSLDKQEAESLGIQEVVELNKSYSEAEYELNLAGTALSLERKARNWARLNLLSGE